jgi:hypothetical protein
VSDRTDCEFALDDAAYVLGVLPTEERLAFERHLASCAECSTSVRSIAGLPGLLARVPADVVESLPVEPVPPTILPALLDEVRRARRRRRWLTGLAAAAVLVLLLGVAAVLAPRDQASPPAAVPQGRAMTQLDQSVVEASVALTPVDWGTRLDLVCTYRAPGGDYADHHAGPTYAMVVHTRSGGTEQVATWTGVSGRTMHVTAATALPAADIASVQVVEAGGPPVLEVEE